MVQTINVISTFSNMTANDWQTAADVFSTIRKDGVEVAEFYKGRVISNDRFEAMVILASETILISQIENLIERMESGDDTARTELEDMTAINGKKIVVLKKLLTS